jgi:hypothetical protein
MNHNFVNNTICLPVIGFIKFDIDSFVQIQTDKKSR